MTDTVKEWGPEIKVDGKRPEWLGDEDRVRWYGGGMGDDWWRNPNTGMGYESTARGLAWGYNITAIRLPADHPYYRRQVAATTSDGLIARMEALVRRVLVERTDVTDYTLLASLRSEARAIVALLPEVVDARELQMAKEIAQRRDLLPVNQETVQDKIIETLVEAIRRGRELQKGEGA